MVSEVECSLGRGSKWNERYLVQFNPTKIQICVFTVKKVYHGPSVPMNNIGFFSVKLSIILIINFARAKTNWQVIKTGVLNIAKLDFTLRQRLAQSKVRPSVE